MTEPMIDGQGELSLEQCRQITDSLGHYSDSRVLVFDRLWKEIERQKMAIEMVATDGAFFTQYNDDTKKHDPSNPRLCLLMNDVFAWACADGEGVRWEDVPEVYSIWKKDGWDGLLVWCCKKRNAKPQKPVFDKLAPEIQEQLKDLPPFGFDDGWGGK